MTAKRSFFYRSVWKSAAQATGAAFVDINESIIEVQSGATRIRVRGNVTSLDDPVTLAMAGDKYLVYRRLEAAGVRVPRHRLCRSDDLSAARQFAATLGGPCVVKPARNSAGGSGVTTGVKTCAQLALSMSFAGAFCADVLVEESVQGENYRLLYFDGELLDAVLRKPPSLRGDGESSIRRLITKENHRRSGGGAETSQSLLHFDCDLRNTLHAQGYTLRSVPSADEIVQLKGAVSDNRSQDNQSAQDRLCSSIVDAGARAAAVIGVRLAGVDLITTNPTVSLETSGGAVIEVNTTPSLYYHMKKEGAATVACVILDRLAARSK